MIQGDWGGGVHIESKEGYAVDQTHLTSVLQRSNTREPQLRAVGACELQKKNKKQSKKTKTLLATRLARLRPNGYSLS